MPATVNQQPRDASQNIGGQIKRPELLALIGVLLLVLAIRSRWGSVISGIGRLAVYHLRIAQRYRSNPAQRIVGKLDRIIPCRDTGGLSCRPTK
jgi:hypothetical protein